MSLVSLQSKSSRVWTACILVFFGITLELKQRLVTSSAVFNHVPVPAFGEASSR